MSLLQKLIHDADCLDIIRARYAFDANYLDFYQTIAKENNQAMQVLAWLIIKSRKIIKQQRDEMGRSKTALKRHYEFADSCFQGTLCDVLADPLFNALYADG